MRAVHSSLSRRSRLPSARVAQTHRSQPPRYKVFLLTWLAIYPLITGIFLLFGSWLYQLPLLLRTLLLTGVLVYLMTYLVMPRLMKIFQSWLLKP